MPRGPQQAGQFARELLVAPVLPQHFARQQQAFLVEEGVALAHRATLVAKRDQQAAGRGQVAHAGSAGALRAPRCCAICSSDRRVSSARGSSASRSQPKRAAASSKDMNFRTLSTGSETLLASARLGCRAGNRTGCRCARDGRRHRTTRRIRAAAVVITLTLTDSANHRTLSAQTPRQGDTDGGYPRPLLRSCAIQTHRRGHPSVAVPSAEIIRARGQFNTVEMRILTFSEAATTQRSMQISTYSVGKAPGICGQLKRFPNHRTL